MNKTGHKKILICISSSISAYKVVDLIQVLNRDGFSISVALTKSALEMFGREMFEKVTGNKIFTELFWPKSNYSDYLKASENEKLTIPHIDLADNFDLILVAPATANIIAKLAGGICDDLITSAISATTKPVLIAPAMNVKMWLNPILQDNVNKLKNYNFTFINPEAGLLACGYEGIGRLASTGAIYNQIINTLNQSTKLKGKRILITGGGTTENIDSVRTISNLSSGKMANALVEESLNQGANILYLKGESAITPSFFVATKEFVTSTDLEKLIIENIQNFDIIIHAAAVSDFKVESIQNKLSSEIAHAIKLIPIPKILPKIKQWNPKIKVVSFKAESNLNKEDLVLKAKKTLDSCQSDLVIANDIAANQIFGVDNSKVLIIGKSNFELQTKYQSKIEIAKIILEVIRNL